MLTCILVKFDLQCTPYTSITPKCNLDSITLSQANTPQRDASVDCCVTGAEPEHKPDPDYATVASFQIHVAACAQAGEIADVTDISVPPPPPPPRVIQQSAAPPIDMFKRALKTERPAYYSIRLYEFGAHVNDSHLALFQQHRSPTVMVLCRMLREYAGQASLWNLCTSIEV